MTCDDAQTVTASTLVLTAPIPQSFSFVFETVETLPRELWSADHDRTIALLAALDGPSALTGSGARHEPSDDIAFVVDHAVKGISPIPAITMNTSPEWSELFWDAPNDEIEAALSELISPFLGSAHVVEQQVRSGDSRLLGQPGRRRAGQITTSSLSSQATHSVALGSRGHFFRVLLPQRQLLGGAHNVGEFTFIEGPPTHEISTNIGSHLGK